MNANNYADGYIDGCRDTEHKLRAWKKATKYVYDNKQSYWQLTTKDFMERITKKVRQILHEVG